MRWHLRHSKDEKFLRRLAKWREKNNQPQPTAWQNKPRLVADLDHVWQAWQMVNIGRPVGMSSSGLPWFDLSSYASDAGYLGDQKLRLCRLLRTMDATFLAHNAEQRQGRRDDSSNDNRNRGRLSRSQDGAG